MRNESGNNTTHAQPEEYSDRPPTNNVIVAGNELLPIRMRSTFMHYTKKIELSNSEAGEYILNSDLRNLLLAFNFFSPKNKVGCLRHQLAYPPHVLQP